MTASNKRRARGLLITFEGIEGSGKSTQLGLLERRLRAAGHEVAVVREPGGTALGEELRRLLLHSEEEPIDDRAELFLYLAARAQLVTRVIRPEMESGRVVLCDRFGDASVAYQGGGRTLGVARVRSLVRFATGGLVPDRTYLLDLSPAKGLARVRSRGKADRLEKEAVAFHRSVRAAYREIADAEPARIRVLRAEQPVEQIAERIGADLARKFPNLLRRPERGA